MQWCCQVGAFELCNICERGLVEPIKQVLASGKPFLGICLGLQILFERSEEARTGTGSCCRYRAAVRERPEI